MRPFWLTAYEPEVQRELFQVGHHNLGGMLVSGLVLMAAVYSAVSDLAPASGIVAWLAVSAVARLFALAVWWRFRPVARDGTPTLAQLRLWARAHVSVMIGMGITVGMLSAMYAPAAAMVQPDLAVHNLFLTIVFVGSAAYSAAGNGTHDLPACLGSIAVACVVMMVNMPAAFGDNTTEMMVLAGMLSLILGWVAAKSHQTVVNAIRLRLANERLAEKHAEAATRAVRASQAKSEFLAAASHDLRQPVHALTLLAEALRREDERPNDPQAGPRRAALVLRISEAAHAIGHLFNELMELSRLESDRHQPDLAPLQPATLLAVLVERQQAPAHSKRLGLSLRIGRSAQSAWVRTDRVMLERIVTNLLTNALRYTDQGRVLVTLRRTGGADGALRLAVHDTGRGIAPADQQRIFDPYVQVSNPQRDREQGLGLGLAIVRQSALKLGLPLDVRSQPGKGSCFSLRLPVSAAALASPPPHQPAEPLQASGDVGLAGRRVLLVDDDPLVRDAMASLFSAWQVDARMAVQADDPLLTGNGLGDWTPELILCDYRLPGRLQGIALLDLLQDRWPGCAALLQTGEPAATMQPLAEEAGYPVLYKPVAPALLASTLRALLPPASVNPV